MKKKLILVIFILLVMVFTEKVGVQAVVSKGKVLTISNIKEDITGDGKKEVITLTGYKIHPNQYKKLVINITESNNAQFKVNLPKGSHPTLKMLDFNNDGVKDLFASVSKSEANSHHVLYTYENKKLLKVDLPDPLLIESRFIDGYDAKIKIRNTGNSYQFDLKKRKKYYERLGLYYKGKLNEPTELMIDGYNHLEPVKMGNKFGLKGSQRIAGTTESDSIGYVESKWSYEHSEWKLVNVKVLQKR